MRNNAPIELSEENIFYILHSLQEKYEELYGNHIYEKKDIPVQQIGQALSEFIDLVLFTSDNDKKHYILKRILSLKSASVLLYELEKYLPIKFNRDVDLETNTLKTFYSPRLLRVTIESLTINNLSSDFITVIDSMFNSLLYFLKYDMTIEELIYKFKLEIAPIYIETKTIPIKRIEIDSNYYLNS